MLAVFPLDWSRPETHGLVEKSLALVAAARSTGLHVDAAFAQARDIRIIRGDCALPPLPSPRAYGRINAHAAALYRYRGFWRALRPYVASGRYDSVWVRAFPVGDAQLALLQEVAASPTALVYDVPTYPVALERIGGLAGWVRSRAYPLDVVAPLADRFVTLSPDPTILGTPCLNVSNGVEVPEAGPPAQASPGADCIVGLGQWADWHGVDRLIEGLTIAQPRTRPTVHLAGRGPAVGGLLALAQARGVQLTAGPPVFGDARARLLGSGTVGLGCLGIHRKEGFPDRALKHRTYAAYGLPFVATPADDAWDDCPAVLQVPSDDEPLDPRVLGDFIARARAKRASWAAELKGRARSLSWRYTYAPLWGYLRTQSRGSYPT